jgi:hypothetical protein
MESVDNYLQYAEQYAEQCVGARITILKPRRQGTTAADGESVARSVREAGYGRSGEGRA